VTKKRDWENEGSPSTSQRTAHCSSQRLVGTSRPVQLFLEPIHCVDVTHYLGVALDTWLTLATYISRVRKKVAQRMGILETLLNKRSGLSIRNGVLLYKQLIHSMMDYACSVWRPTT